MPTQNIPNGWKKVKLGEVSTFEYGYSQSASEKEIGPKFLRITDISKDNLDWDSVPYCEISDFNFEKYKLKNGDIVVARTGATAGYAKYIKNPPRSVFAGYLIRINPLNDLVRNDFLGPLIESNIFKEFIKKYIQGAAQPQANVPVIKEFEFPLPPLPIQQKIASILSKYDDLIENNNKRIKILEQMGQKGLQMILAEDYQKIEEKPILEENEYFEFIRENVKKFEGEKIYYATADIDGINIVGKGEKVNYENKPSRAQKQPIINSVWFARMIDTYKVLVFSDINKRIADNILLSSGMVGFKAKDDLYLPFLFWTINNKNFHKIKDSYCTGATQRALTNDGLKMIKIKFPAKENIIKFGKIAKPILDEILNLQLQNQNLTQTRDLLIPRLVSGKLDVANIEVL